MSERLVDGKTERVSFSFVNIEISSPNDFGGISWCGSVHSPNRPSGMSIVNNVRFPLDDLHTRASRRWIRFRSTWQWCWTLNRSPKWKFDSKRGKKDDTIQSHGTKQITSHRSYFNVAAFAMQNQSVRKWQCLSGDCLRWNRKVNNPHGC